MTPNDCTTCFELGTMVGQFCKYANQLPMPYMSYDVNFGRKLI